MFVINYYQTKRIKQAWMLKTQVIIPEDRIEVDGTHNGIDEGISLLNHDNDNDNDDEIVPTTAVTDDKNGENENKVDNPDVLYWQHTNVDVSGENIK